MTYGWDILGALPWLCLLRLENTPSSFHEHCSPPLWLISFTKLVQILPYSQQLTLDCKFCPAIGSRHVIMKTTHYQILACCCVGYPELGYPFPHPYGYRSTLPDTARIEGDTRPGHYKRPNPWTNILLGRFLPYQHQCSRSESSCIDGHHARELSDAARFLPKIWPQSVRDSIL